MNIQYLSGLVDGEGFIGIAKQIRKDRPSPAYRTIFQIANTHKLLMDTLKQEFGGNVYIITREANDKGWKEQYVWHCYDTKTAELLPQLIPYLIVKKQQAILIIEFIKNKKTFKRKSLGVGKGSSPLSQGEIDYREILYQKVKVLNKRGTL